MRPEQKFCRTLPNIKYFTQMLQTRQPRNVSPIPTRPNTPVSETIDLNTFAISADNDILTASKEHLSDNIFDGFVVVQTVANGGVAIGSGDNDEIKEWRGGKNKTEKRYPKVLDHLPSAWKFEYE